MARQTRREFLEDSMLATAAAVASSQLPQLVQAADKKPAGPNDKLRVAIVGVNGRGAAHISGFSKIPECEIVAICDADEEVGHKKGVDKIEKMTRKKPAFHQDIRKLLEDKDIDIVSIATPNHWHALGAIWAIQAGKQVYVEKPVSHNVSEGRRIVEAARKHNKICQAGTQSRSSKGLQEAVAWMQAGNLGKVSLARGLCYKPRNSIGPRGTYAVPASVNYDLWSGPAPLNPVTRKRFHYDWHWQWDYGNGDLGNQGIHQMDIARWGLGVNDLGISVLSYGGRFGYEDAGETANTQINIHDYGDKTLVFEVRGLKTNDLKGAKIGVLFYGEKGYMVVPSYSSATAFDLDGKVLAKFGGGESSHFKNFVDAIHSGKYSDLNGEILDGHLSSALCHLGNISYKLGEQASVADIQSHLAQTKVKTEALETFDRFSRHLADNNVDLQKHHITYGPTLAIDGKAETFTGPGSDKANPMLTRDYRKGFVVPSSANV
jgi:predicted dehydrogenase